MSIDRAELVGLLLAERDHRMSQQVKQSARLAARQARLDGKITEQPCARCGLTRFQADMRGTRIEMHHADHSRPLDVEWLCRQCHRRADAAANAARCATGARRRRLEQIAASLSGSSPCSMHKVPTRDFLRLIDRLAADDLIRSTDVGRMRP